MNLTSEMLQTDTKNSKKVKTPSFDDIYMNLAESLAQKSHCVKQKVGAVLTKETRIVSLGYNGPPAGTHNCDEEWPENGCARDRKGSCSLALHAEANAILYAAKNKVDMDGSTLYVTLSPCLPCARIIFSVGIKKVFYLKSYAHYKGIESDEGVEFLTKFGIQVSQYIPDSNV
jgi:dCMP deaminase